MATNPFLLFRDPTPLARTGRGGGSDIKTGIGGKQLGRLSQRLQRFQRSIASAELSSTVDGTAPDLVIVLEAREKIQKVAEAARKLGLWVIEEEEFAGMELDDVEMAELGDRTNAFGKGALYLTIGDADSRARLLSAFEAYSGGETAPQGLTQLWKLFTTLHDVRVWNAADRVAGTGLGERLIDLRANGDDRARIEIELWYRGETEREAARELWLKNVGDTATVISERVIEEIAYHGLLVDVAIDDAVASQMLNPGDDAPTWVQDARARTVRPAAQFAHSVDATEETDREVVPGPIRALPDPPDGEPLVAVLDGLPQQAHPLLKGWIQLDDPDDWGSTVEAEHRQHGTAMCSIVCHGDLHRPGGSLKRPIYARPIMRPVATWRPGRDEMPTDRLAVDLLEVAVERLVAERPSVRVVNLSIGDEGAVHIRQASPLARLSDFLAWKHGLLFVVSAGNRADRITLHGIAAGALSASSRDARHAAAMTCLAREAAVRRLRPPAEALNALTVGASHDDRSGHVDGRAQRYELVQDGAPSPFSAHGPGLNRSIKPDLLVPGGRLVYQEPLMGAGTGDCIVEVLNLPGLRTAPPGIVVARAGAPSYSGDPGVGFSWGTSDSAAYTSHLAGALLESIEERIDGMDADDLDASTAACLAKALVSHHARHGTWHGDLLGEYEEFKKHRLELASRIAGNGAVDPETVLAVDRSDDHATLVAFGYVRQDEILAYEFPVPDEVRDTRSRREFTVTLASLVPTTALRSIYRPHWIETNVDSKALKSLGFESRTNNEWRAARRGTLQHDIWESTKSKSWNDGSTLQIEVTGRSYFDAPGPMPFALVATFAVNDPAVAIYQSVRARVQTPVRIGRVATR